MATNDDDDDEDDDDDDDAAGDGDGDGYGDGDGNGDGDGVSNYAPQKFLGVFTLAAGTIDSDAQVFATLLFAAVPRGRAMAPEPRRRAGQRPRTCRRLQLVMRLNRRR